MVKILEMQHMVDNIHENQSRILEWESFEEYCTEFLINNKSLPIGSVAYDKKVSLDKREMFCKFDWENNKNTMVMVHFAKVIE